MPRRLAFYNHHRPLYEPVQVEAQFSVGFFARDGGVWPGGSFVVNLHRFHQTNPGDPFGPDIPAESLVPRVLVFNDGFEAVREFDRLGGLHALEHETIRTRDDLSRILLRLGLWDDSHDALGATAA